MPGVRNTERRQSSPSLASRVADQPFALDSPHNVADTGDAMCHAPGQRRNDWAMHSPGGQDNGTRITVSEPSPIGLALVNKLRADMVLNSGETDSARAIAAAASVDTAVDFVHSGQVKTGDLITHRFPLDRIKEGFETQLDPGNSIKVVITP